MVEEIITYLKDFFPNKNKHIPLYQFLSDLPINASLERKLKICGELKLYPILLERSWDGLSENLILFLLFLKTSLQTRKLVTKSILDNLVETSHQNILPIKYSNILYKNAPYIENRYFRDIDFAILDSDIPKLPSIIKSSNLLLAEIDSSDWNKYQLYENVIVTDEIRKNSEIHLLNIQLIYAPQLTGLYNQILSKFGKVNETQFYGYISNNFSIRVFVDLMLKKRNDVLLHLNKKSPLVCYLSDITSDAMRDINKGRVSLTQILEISFLAENTKLTRDIPKTLQANLNLIIAPAYSYTENITNALNKYYNEIFARSSIPALS